MKNELINRPNYITWLDRWRDKNVIKVVTGLRRCGKSSILELYRNQLRERDAPHGNILSINFESMEEEHPPKIVSLMLV